MLNNEHALYSKGSVYACIQPKRGQSLALDQRRAQRLFQKSQTPRPLPHGKREMESDIRVAGEREVKVVQILSMAINEITGKQVRRAGAGPACDGWMFLAKGIPTICGYGIARGGVHGADEWADLGSLRQVTEVYAQTIITFLSAS